jgi:hypothetical protein
MVCMFLRVSTASRHHPVVSAVLSAPEASVVLPLLLPCWQQRVVDTPQLLSAQQPTATARCVYTCVCCCCLFRKLQSCCSCTGYIQPRGGGGVDLVGHFRWGWGIERVA